MSWKLSDEQRIRLVVEWAKSQQAKDAMDLVDSTESAAAKHLAEKVLLTLYDFAKHTGDLVEQRVVDSIWEYLKDMFKSEGILKEE